MEKQVCKCGSLVDFFGRYADGKCEPCRIADYQAEYIRHIEERGYKELTDFVPAPLGWSELCMHTRNTEAKPMRVFVSASGAYAYALLDNGKFLDGCFTQYADKTICLS